MIYFYCSQIGNWSRWLTDLFGMDDGNLNENEDDDDDENEDRQDSSFKSFHLLNALSDLMMLPKDMLLSRSIRKEVTPNSYSSHIVLRDNTFQLFTKLHCHYYCLRYAQLLVHH